MQSTNKIVKIGLCITLSTILLRNCWTSENDIKEVQTLIGSFKIILSENDKNAAYTLSFNDGQEGYEIIEKRCEILYYDSTKIFVKYKWGDFDTTHHFSRINILKGEKRPYKKQELSSKDFYRNVKACSECLESDLSKKPSE